MKILGKIKIREEKQIDDLLEEIMK